MTTVSRRGLILGAVSLGAAAAIGTAATAGLPPVHVLKDPGCGCCDAWVAILRAEGFDVTTEPRSAGELHRDKLARGIPRDMVSCHTGEVAGYAIEGHVPPAEIRRLLAERPEAIGLAVPGMPYGSPGMGPETEREAYDVILIRPDGRGEIYARYPAA